MPSRRGRFTDRVTARSACSSGRPPHGRRADRARQRRPGRFSGRLRRDGGVGRSASAARARRPAGKASPRSLPDARCIQPARAAELVVHGLPHQVVHERERPTGPGSRPRPGSLQRARRRRGLVLGAPDDLASSRTSNRCPRPPRPATRSGPRWEASRGAGRSRPHVSPECRRREVPVRPSREVTGELRMKKGLPPSLSTSPAMAPRSASRTDTSPGRGGPAECETTRRAAGLCHTATSGCSGTLLIAVVASTRALASGWVPGGARGTASTGPPSAGRRPQGGRRRSGQRVDHGCRALVQPVSVRVGSLENAAGRSPSRFASRGSAGQVGLPAVDQCA